MLTECFKGAEDISGLSEEKHTLAIMFTLRMHGLLWLKIHGCYFLSQKNEGLANSAAAGHADTVHGLGVKCAYNALTTGTGFSRALGSW